MATDQHTCISERRARVAVANMRVGYA